LILAVLVLLSSFNLDLLKSLEELWSAAWLLEEAAWGIFCSAGFDFSLAFRGWLK
jgi:hypothetical protein